MAVIKHFSEILDTRHLEQILMRLHILSQDATGQRLFTIPGIGPITVITGMKNMILGIRGVEPSRKP
jgi:hypothetical protein